MTGAFAACLVDFRRLGILGKTITADLDVRESGVLNTPDGGGDPAPGSGDLSRLTSVLSLIVAADLFGLKCKSPGNMLAVEMCARFARFFAPMFPMSVSTLYAMAA